jgi:hypothetical protein
MDTRRMKTVRIADGVENIATGDRAKRIFTVFSPGKVWLRERGAD